MNPFLLHQAVVASFADEPTTFEPREGAVGFCGCLEQFGDGSPALKLATNRPLVFVQDALPSWGKDAIWDWIAEGYERWAKVCDWKGRRIMDMNEAGPTDVVHLITVADLGGSGVLADQMLPYTGGRVLKMRINSRIKWQPTNGQMPSGTVDPIRTLCHETGHFMGHSHWPQGAPPELMEPYVQQGVIGPQPTEGKVSAGWFGQPGPVTPPPPPGGGGYDFSEIHLRYNGLTGVEMDLVNKMIRLKSPTGLVITDKKGNPGIVTWPPLPA